jgi:hypothetical protein
MVHQPWDIYFETSKIILHKYFEQSEYYVTAPILQMVNFHLNSTSKSYPNL